MCTSVAYSVCTAVSYSNRPVSGSFGRNESSWNALPHLLKEAILTAKLYSIPSPPRPKSIQKIGMEYFSTKRFFTCCDPMDLVTGFLLKPVEASAAQNAWALTRSNTCLTIKDILKSLP